MSRYTKLKKTADRLIKKYDERKNVVLVSTGKTFNQATLKNENTDTETTIRAVVATEHKAIASAFDAGQIQTGDIMLVITGEHSIEIGGRVRVDSKEYSIIDSRPVNPGGTNVVNRALCRA